MSMEEVKPRSRVMDIPLDVDANEIQQEFVAAPKVIETAEPRAQYWWVDGGAIFLMIVAIVASSAFWVSWMERLDGRVFSAFCAVGIIVGLCRANYSGKIGYGRGSLGTVAWITSMALIVVSIVSVRPKVGVIALAFVVIGWGVMRVAGDGPMFGAGLAFAFLFPMVLDELIQDGMLDWISPTSVAMTSRIADLFKIAHARDGGTIVFQQGVADGFSPVGTWDSALGILGLAVGVFLCFRRNLVVSVLSMGLSLVVWFAIRTLAWLLVVEFSIRQGEWIGWSLQVSVLAWVGAAVVYVLSEQFLAAMCEPIHEQYLVVDYPLLSMTWNWIFGLPKLSVHLPVRQVDLGPIDTDTELLRNG